MPFQRTGFRLHAHLFTFPANSCVSLGCGEHLVRTLLARECSRALQNEDAHQALLETMQNKFISKYAVCSPMSVTGMENSSQKQIKALAVV